MKAINLFKSDENIWIKKDQNGEVTFAKATIQLVKDGQILVLLENGNTENFHSKDIGYTVIKSESTIDLFVEGYLTLNSKPKTGVDLSEEEYLDAIDSHSWSLLKCDACLSNQGFNEEVEIDGLEYVNSVKALFGEVENYYLENVYKLNGVYYVSAWAGNSHYHIGKMDEEMVKELEKKLSSKNLIEQNK